MDQIDEAAAKRTKAKFIPGRVGLVVSSERGKAKGRLKVKGAWAARRLLERLDQAKEGGAHE